MSKQTYNKCQKYQMEIYVNKLHHLLRVCLLPNKRIYLEEKKVGKKWVKGQVLLNITNRINRKKKTYDFKYEIKIEKEKKKNRRKEEKTSEH